MNLLNRRPRLPAHGAAFFLILPAMLVTLPLTPAEAARHALLVGHSAGSAEEARLRYVENDLSALRRVLVDVCGFEKQNVVSLYNGTPGDLDAAIATVSERVSRSPDNDLILLYYSGHADDRSLKLGADRYDLTTLKSRFSGVPAEIRIGIFDACQSGSFTRLKGGTLAEPFLFLSDDKVKGQVILSSSSPNESAQESDAYRNSVFTFHLVNGLRGSADASGDGKVTLGEAYQYAYNHTVAATARSAGGAQHPGYQFSIQGEGEIVLADLTIRTAGIMLGQDVEGDITVIDGQGAIVADLRKSAGSATMIALNPGTYQITRRAGADAYTASAEVRASGVTTVAGAGFQPLEAYERPRTKGAAEGRTHVDLTATFGYELMGLKSISDEMNRIFAGYSVVGLYPSFWMPRGRFTGTGGFEVWVKDALQLTAAVGYTSFEHEWSWTSTVADPVTGNSYGCSLTNSQKLDIWTVYTGPGIKVRRGLLKNLTLHVGLQACMVTFDTRTVLTDSLYDIGQTNDFEESGSIIVPVIGAAYRYPVFPWLDAGVMIRYRYQKQPATLDGESRDDYYGYGGTPAPAFTYGLGGIDGRVFVCYRIGRH